jgi:ParB family transcriptional regulator, chromosome partitioning protein
MATKKKDRRAAHGTAGVKDLWLYDPEELVLVTEEDHDLYDERVHLKPTEEMILNVMEYGVLQSITGRKNTETGKMEVVDGRQRTLALREANKRIKKAGGEPHRIPLQVKRSDPGTVIGVMVTLNEIRSDDTPSNRAKKAARMLERGKTEEEVARAFGCSTATLKNMLRVTDATAVLRNAADAGKIAMSDAYKLAKLEPEEQRKRVAQLLVSAPRVPGKKRSPNAKKAREIVGGPARKPAASERHDGMRELHQLENLRGELESGEQSEARKGAIAALAWVMGDDDALKVLT